MSASRPLTAADRARLVELYAGAVPVVDSVLIKGAARGAGALATSSRSAGSK